MKFVRAERTGAVYTRGHSYVIFYFIFKQGASARVCGGTRVFSVPPRVNVGVRWSRGRTAKKNFRGQKICALQGNRSSCKHGGGA